MLFRSVQAGGGHAHGPGGHAAQKPVSSEKAIDLASKKVAELAKRGVIDKSWENAGSSEIEKKTYGPRKEWKVTFKNDKVKEASKQTLYLFYRLGGKYIAANYTGK